MRPGGQLADNAGGHQTDNSRRPFRRPADSSLPAAARAGQLAVICWTCFFLAGCALTERITRSRTVQIDSVATEAVTRGHTLDASVRLADSLLVEDERLRLRLWRLPELTNDAAAEAPPGVSAAGNELSGRWRLRAEVKPETVRVKVPQKTITETEERVRYVPQTPRWMWAVVGGLVMLILILSVAFKIRT